MNAVARNHRLDLLRVIALMMIILMHSPMPHSAPGYVLSCLSYLTAPGIGLFFMISGALLLGTELPMGVFLKKRFTKVVFPLLFWTLFYVGDKAFLEGWGAERLLTSVISIPFSAQGHGVLWFMYTLAGLYLLAPILSKWLKAASKGEVEFYLLLWAITLLYPYLNKFLIINESNTGILYYFSGYLGYFVLGYYLNEYYIFKVWHLVIALLLVIGIPVALYGSGIEFDFYEMLWYLSMPVALMAFIWHVSISKCPNHKIEFITEVAKLSFGIYLVHIFVMRRVLYQVDFLRELPSEIQIPVISITTFIVSLVLVWLISRLPFSKYLIGV